MTSVVNWIVVLLAIGLVTSFGAWRRAGRGLAASAAALLCVVAVLPVGGLLQSFLETRFPPYSPGAQQITGIIVLGGSVSLRDEGGVARPEPNEAADRLFVTARLAKTYPTARVLVCGGPVSHSTGRAEADRVADYLVALGVAPQRLVLERNSANTAQNARNAAALIRPARAETWLLVTSAFHMPRAAGAFRAAGFHVTPAPADWRGGWGRWPAAWSASANLRALDVAAKEYVALIVYRVRGDTGSLLPSA